MLKKCFTPFLALALIAGCQSSKTPPALPQRVADAHGQEMYSAMEGMSGDIHVVFNEGLQFDAHFSVDLSTGKTRMVLLDDSVLVFDGKDCWVSPPSNTKITNARYHLQTWPFLITMPLALKNQNVGVRDIGKSTFGSTQYNALLLSVPSGGNAGDYTLFVDEKSDFVKAAACMSATAKTPTTAQSGYAISFYSYKPFDGVFIATDWKIWQYSPDKGITGMPIGEAKVYNVEFSRLKESVFTPPSGARKE